MYQMIPYRIKKTDLLDDIILLVMICHVMFFRWLGLDNVVNLLLTVLLALDFILNARYESKDTFVFYLTALFLYFAFNYVKNPGKVSLLFQNVYRGVRPILIISYFSRLIIRKPDYVFRTIKRLIIPLNIYILINIPVLFLQSRGMLFLTARDMSKATSRVVEDYYSGLFGLYGTPCLAVYCVMIFLGNFVYADKYAARANRKYIKVYNWLLALFFCGFSMINDNKFFYIELVLFGAIYYIAKHRTEGNLILLSGEKTKSKKLWFKVFVLSCGSVVVFLLGYRYISPFRGMIDLFVRKLFQGLNYTNVKGGGERIGMILYVLNSSARFFGFGFACIADEAGTLGFEHFGQADIATFIACGGIAYILLLMILIKVLLFRTYNKKLIPFLLLITCFVMMAYTRALRDSSTLVSLMLAFLAIWSVNHPDYLGTGL